MICLCDYYYQWSEHKGTKSLSRDSSYYQFMTGMMVKVESKPLVILASTSKHQTEEA